MNGLAFLMALQQLRTPMLDSIMVMLTHLGDAGLLWISIGLIMSAQKERRANGSAMLLALALEALCCNLILKPLVARPRPFTLAPGIELLVPPPSDWSFPSGHTGAAFAAVFSTDRVHPALLVLALLISFSRLYLFVHYPGDVLAGALLGLAMGRIANGAVAFFRDKRK